MRAFHRHEVQHGAGYDTRILGVPPPTLRDLYHWLLRVPGWAALAFIVVAWLLVAALFAEGYATLGGVANARPGSLEDAFYFSVQTLGTIGYGTMEPVSRSANVLVTVESVCGLVATALATGLVFARFSQTRARVMFSSRVAIGPWEGTPTLMIRMGNARRGRIVDARFHLTMARTIRTQEGVAVYRTSDLPLTREVAPALSRSWMVIHPLGPRSPLREDTPESLIASEVELTLSVSGVDETSMQQVHAQHLWPARSVVWGARLADVLTEQPNGDMLLDLRRFHDLVPTAPVEGFPYQAEEGEDGVVPAAGAAG